jgi:hypothetical protein
MIHKNIKLVLSGASLGYSIYQFIEGNIGNGIFFYPSSGTNLILLLQKRVDPLVFSENA